MKTALYRWYTKDNGEKVKALQGKVFEIEGKDIFYRDVHLNKSRLWMEDGAYNLDFQTYQFLRNNDIFDVHYYLTDKKILLITTTRKIANALEKNRVKLQKLNGHRQLFLPRYIFKEYKRWYRVPWIKKETDISNPNRRVLEDYSIPNETRSKLKEAAIKQGWYQPAGV